MATRAARMSEKPEDLPMTPMIDVVFQLMIYFIFTFKIPMAMAVTPVYRPAAAEAPVSGEPSVRITVLHDGYLANERPADLETLRGWLAKLARLDPDQNIAIRVADGSQHHRLMRLLDACAQAKLKNFSIITLH